MELTCSRPFATNTRHSPAATPSRRGNAPFLTFPNDPVTLTPTLTLTPCTRAAPRPGSRSPSKCKRRSRTPSRAPPPPAPSKSDPAASPTSSRRMPSPRTRSAPQGRGWTKRSGTPLSLWGLSWLASERRSGSEPSWPRTSSVRSSDETTQPAYRKRAIEGSSKHGGDGGDAPHHAVLTGQTSSENSLALRSVAAKTFCSRGARRSTRRSRRR